MSQDEHRERHRLLHKHLDELLTDYIMQTGIPLAAVNVVELLTWSYDQVARPTGQDMDLVANPNHAAGDRGGELSPKNVLIILSGGIVDDVKFFEDDAEALRALEDFVKTIDMDRLDAELYSEKGFVTNAKRFLDEWDQ